MPFRSTAQLGAQFTQHAAKFHWDGENVDVSYRLGNPEMGTDGHLYVLVQAGANFAASDGLSINQSTWVASADASDPEWGVPADIEGGTVTNGEYFHARKTAL